ncbi:putative amidohydrolase [Friedmanniella endophytica]|uniref:Putative amidohydrolase n=1 Tax=Microlunatus kandeliicorticis TaxID=1759536 RepID=A0A7W3P787_9ACTN|nr:nitrilase-related carbon-nitrogen hydrolase [Microlunatus kandeliicorticis]MBA8795871.1 putative amidohydrolase [Microlunatus kandeliicorticis]
MTTVETPVETPGTPAGGVSPRRGPQTVRLGIGQLRIDVDDPAGTWHAVEQTAARAAAEGVELLVLPELAACGYVFADHAEALARSEDLDGPTVAAYRELSRRHGLVLAAGFAERGEAGRVHNSALLVEDGELRAVYRKAHLWDAEKLYFTPGSAPAPVVDTRVGRLGLMICYDLEFPEFVRDVALRGAEVLLAPSNWPTEHSPGPGLVAETIKSQANAACNRIWMVVADRTGVERGQHWVGGSMVCDPLGAIVTEPVLGREGWLVADLDLARARDKTVTSRNHAFGDRRPELYGGILSP